MLVNFHFIDIEIFFDSAHHITHNSNKFIHLTKVYNNC